MRISGGTLRGRRLQTRADRQTRPTSERAREGLFSWLGERVSGSAVLDLYAGTGSLGIEALSRGAASAVFVEFARPALAVLRRNCRDLGLGPVTEIVAMEAAAAIARLRRSGRRFDLVLADPPYGGRDWLRLAEQGDLVDILAPGAVLLVERSRRDGPVAGDARLLRRSSKQYGDAAFDWYQVAPLEERGAG